MTSTNFVDVQVKHFENVIRDLGQGSFYEMELPNGWGKGPIYEEGDEEYSRMLEDVTGLFAADWELEMVVNHGWFDDGGKSVTLWMVNKEARERVWADIDKNNRAYFPEKEYTADMQSNPEDYRIFISGPY